MSFLVRRSTISNCFVALMVIASVSACGDDDDEPRDAAIDAARDASHDAGRDSGRDAQHDVDASVTLTDGEIVQVLRTIHGGEIALGQLALQTSDNAAVDDLAGDIVADHTTALMTLENLIDARNIDPVQSPLSIALMQTMMLTHDMLDARSGAAFDAAYATSVVDMHTTVLALIDERLSVDADDDQLRAVLSATRSSVMMHRARGEQLVEMLEPDAGP